MSFKDEIKAAEGKSDGAATGGAASENDDIARLLRALNEDLKADPHGLSADPIEDDEDEEVETARSSFPLGKIALALLAAGGIGIGVVMFDGSKSEPKPDAAAQTAAATAAVAPVAAGGGTATPPPLTLNPKGPNAGQPEALIARAPASGPAPVQAPAQAPVAATPAPVPPIPAPPGRVEPAPVPPPVLPAAPSGTQTVVKPIEPPAIPRLDPPKPAPVQAKAPEILKAPEPRMAEPRMAEPRMAEPRSAEPKAPEVKVADAPAPAMPAPEAKAPEANTTELQAMLSPPKAAQGSGKPGKAKASPAAKAESAAPAAPRPAPSTGGRWAVQAGSFSVAENAQAVQRQLAAKGYSAQVIDWTDSAQRTWKVVRVGGYDNQADAKRVAGEVKSSLGLAAMVVSGR